MGMNTLLELFSQCFQIHIENQRPEVIITFADCSHLRGGSSQEPVWLSVSQGKMNALEQPELGGKYTLYK